MARSKEERDALRAELEQEEADEAERSKRGGSSQNLHVDVTEAVRDGLIDRKEGRRLLGLDDDGGDDGDDDGDDDGKDKDKKKKPGAKDDDDDDAPADRTPKRRSGYFQSGDE